MSVGKPISRVDGIAKVTGAARYVADAEASGMTHAVTVMSTIARGRVTAVDTTRASAAPGVLGVFTHRNMPRIALPSGEARYVKGFLPVQDDRIRHAGQPVAVVVAQTLEQAQHAATLVAASYRAEAPQVLLSLDEAYVPEPGPFGPPTYARGDVTSGLASAQVKVEATYTTPLQEHNPMEPTAAVAGWDGGRLTVYLSTQSITDVQNSLMEAFGLRRENVRVICPYLGGGFGGKGLSWPQPILAAAVARQIRRPVKLVLTRADTYTSHGHRSETHHALRVGATREGRLTAIDHTLTQHVSRTDESMCNGTEPTKILYACPNVRTTMRAVRSDLPTAGFVRSPESVANHALESALDELGYALDLDPVELRIRNWSDTNQETGERHGSSYLRECYRQGAERFGWSRRNPRPGSMRDGDELIGWGMATAAHVSGGLAGAGAAVTVTVDGTARIRSGTQDVGTGTYTVMAQVGAEVLGMPVRSVRFSLGDSVFPRSVPAVASTTVPSVGAAVARAAAEARKRVIAIAVADRRGPLRGVSPDEVRTEDGYLIHRSKRVGYREVMRRHGRPIEVTVEPPEQTPMSYSVGAYFTEVRVHPGLGRIRVRRVVGVFDPGRVLNQKTARGQAIGGATWCIGLSLTEHALVDPHLGRIVTPNLSTYLIPVNADVPDIDVDFIDRPDPSSDALGARGFGEVPSTGLTAAIGNAVHHAIGKRIRDLPITQDKIIQALS
ncbi:xanthine dehydrogenase family protein molybdopterin-binding subunit [Streptosporangium sp. NPDC000509]|uniref:xanthine dehydrogenase family protein molybdopterin-binding subunit n=1 Tax=Streptosporangium sp. NPDC000509 TaxID=3366186 RepID=UPI0036975F4D